MTSNNVQEVRGFIVDTINVKQDKIKITLIADKDDVGGGTLTMGDILTALEIHSTSEGDVGLVVSPAEQSV